MSDSSSSQSPPPSSSPSPAPRPRRRRWLRITLRVVIILLVLLVLLALLAPTLISTGPGTQLALSFVNRNIAGKISAGSLSVGWFSGQAVTGLDIKDPEGNSVIKVEKIDIPDTTLLKLLRGNYDLGTIKLSRPVVELAQDKNGQLNLARAFASARPAAATPATESPASPSAAPAAGSPSPLAGLRMNLNLTDGRITYSSPDAPAVAVNLTRLDAAVASLKSISVDVDAQVASGADSGDIKGKVQLTDLLDAQLKPDFEHGSVDADLNASNVPVAAADRLARQDGRLAALLGRILNASVKVKGGVSNLDATVIARADNLDTNLAIQMRDHKVSLPAASPQVTQRVKLTVQPAAWTAWTAQPGPQASVKLLAPFDVTVALSALQFQLSAVNQPDLSTLVADLGLSLGQIQLDAGGDIGAVTLEVKPGSIGFNRKGEERRLVADFAATARYQNRSGDLGASVAVDDVLDRTGKFNRSGAHGAATVSVRNWPMAIVDQLARTGDVCRAGIGPTLDELKVVTNIQPGAAAGGGATSLSGDVTLSVKSKNLNGGLAGRIADDRFTSRAPEGRTAAGFDWDVQRSLLPAVFGHFAPGSAALQKVALAGDSARVTLDIEQLVVPLSGVMAKEVELKARVSSKDLSLVGVPTLDTAGLRDLGIDLAFSGSGNTADVTTTCAAVLPGGQGPIHIEGHLAGLLDGRGSPALSRARGTISADASNLPPALIDKAMNKAGLGAALLGSPLAISVSQTPLSPAKSGGLPNTDKPLTLTVKSTNLNATIPLTLADGILTADPSSKVTLALQPAAVVLLAKSAEPGRQTSVGLAQPANIELDITRLSSGLQGDAWKHARLAANLTVDKLATTGDQRLAAAGLSQLEVAIPETTIDQGLSVAIRKGDLLYGTDKGSLSGEVKLSGITGGAFRYSAKLDMEKLPVALADAFNGGDLRLTDVLGAVIEKLSLYAAPNDKDADELAFSAKVAAKAVNADIAGAFKAGAYASLNKSSYAQLDLEPKGFAALKHWLAGPAPTDPVSVAPGRAAPGSAATNAASDDTTLGRTASVRLDVDDLAVLFVPASAGGGLDAAKSHLAVRLSLPAGIGFHSDARKEDAEVGKLTFDIKSANLADRIDLAAAGETRYQTAGNQPLAGQIKVANTSVAHLFDPKTGQVDRSTMVVTTDTTLSALSVGAVDALAGQNGKLLGILGPVLESLTAKGRYIPASDTVFDIALQSTNTNATMPMALSKDQVLTIRPDASAGPAKAQILKITPELAKMLSMVHPLLLSAVGNQKPIDLTIDKPSFRVPLQPFSSADPAVKKAAINGITLNAVLDLGTLEMTHGSLTKGLGQVASLVGAGGMRDQFHAAFNPLQVHLADGKIATNDLWLSSFDLFSGRYAGLGVKVITANLGKDPIDGDLAVALPGLMVRQIRGLDRYITPDYVFSITKSGPLSSMQIDWSSFAADILKMNGKVEALAQAERLAGNNPLAAMAVRAAADQVINAIPGGKQQGDVQQIWPARPKEMPRDLPGLATQPAATTSTRPGP